MESGYGDRSGSGSAAGAYGSPGATGQFQPMTFITKPQVIVRIIGLVFAIIVFGCISSQGYEKDHCGYGSPGPCGYGIFVGVTAFLLLAVFLVFDAMFDNISNVMNRKYIVIGDILTSCLWAFLYFVGFCYLTDKLRWNYNENFWGIHGLQAAIAFSFFSIGVFAALAVLAVLRYRVGITEDLSIRPDFGDPSDHYAQSGGQ